MLVEDRHWRVVERNFSLEERTHIHEAIVAQGHEPRGFIINPKALDPKLLRKLQVNLGHRT